MSKKITQIKDLSSTVRLIEEYARNNDFINFKRFASFLTGKQMAASKELFESALAKSELCAFEPVTGDVSTGWLIHEAKAVEMGVEGDMVVHDDLKNFMDNSQPGPDDIKKTDEPLGGQASVNPDDDLGMGEVGPGGEPCTDGLDKKKDVDLKDDVVNDDKDTSWNLTNSLGSVMKESKINGGLQELRSNYKTIAEGVKSSITDEMNKLPKPMDNATTRFVVESKNSRISVKEPFKAIVIAEELSAIGGVADVSVSSIMESNGSIIRANYKLPKLAARLPLFVNNSFLFANKPLAESFADHASESNHTSTISEHRYGAAVTSKMTLSDATKVLQTMTKR